MKPRPNLDALAFCFAWAALAVVGWRAAGLAAGLILSIGLLPPIMLASMAILSKTGSFAAERAVRWGMLAMAAIGLASYVDVAG